MNTRLHLAPALAVLLPAAAGAQVFQFNDLDAPVPDGHSSGLVQVGEVTGLAVGAYTVRVQLELAAAGADGSYLGDLYVALQHGDQLAVLLNRPGRRPDRPGGYGDVHGLAVTFDDAAPADVHFYRQALAGSHATPLDGPLTGAWQPDGRATDPDLAVWAADRTALLTGLAGTDPNGAWTLHVVDLSPGGAVTLESWALELVPVPEPAAWGWAAALGLLAAGALRRRHGRTGAVN